MEDKTETVLDHTYLRPGIVTRAGAIGLAAIGIGAGVLFACYGASFFFNTNAHLASIEGSLKELKHRPIISDSPGPRGKTINGNVIMSEVTMFHLVRHDKGSIYTGWKYPDGASANQPPIAQYCYWQDWVGDGASVRIDLANNGVRLPNIANGVPRLEDALKKCVWWNGSTN
jgi:hypothetical protein